MTKITIIGTGCVGSTIAYTLAVQGMASEIVLIDINKDKAIGEALDIYQGTPYCSACNIYAGDYADAEGSDIVVLTSGVARKPGQSRLDLAQINVNITKSIIPEITKAAPNATYVIVSNPVDILTYTFCKCSDIPHDRIIGSGTILDTSRLRSTIAECYDVNPQNVHAYALGEHGDSLFVPWSLADISNIKVEDYAEKVQRTDGNEYILNKPEIEEHVRKSGAKVIKNKGATFYAVSISVCHLIKALLSGADTILPVSTMLNGEYGIEDVCLSLPNIVGSKTAHGKLVLPLNDDEIALLKKSADTLKDIINGIEW